MPMRRARCRPGSRSRRSSRGVFCRSEPHHQSMQPRHAAPRTDREPALCSATSSGTSISRTFGSRRGRAGHGVGSRETLACMSAGAGTVHGAAMPGFTAVDVSGVDTNGSGRLASAHLAKRLAPARATHIADALSGGEHRAGSRSPRMDSTRLARPYIPTRTIFHNHRRRPMSSGKRTP